MIIAGEHHCVRVERQRQKNTGTDCRPQLAAPQSGNPSLADHAMLPVNAQVFNVYQISRLTARRIHVNS
jgi:hypothetical protein